MVQRSSCEKEIGCSCLQIIIVSESWRKEQQGRSAKKVSKIAVNLTEFFRASRRIPLQPMPAVGTEMKEVRVASDAVKFYAIWTSGDPVASGVLPSIYT